MAQQVTNKRRGVNAEFVTKRTDHLSHEISSNVIRIINNSEKPITFSLNLSVPDGWLYISKRANQFTIAQYDSLFIPVNLIPKKNNAGNVSHIVNASLVAENGLQFASALWYMSIKVESNWNASLKHNKIFFLDDSDTAHFYVRLQNLGNSEEDIKMNFSSDRRLRVLDTKNRFTEIHYFNIKIPVNADTLIAFQVEKFKPVQQNFREDFDVAKLVQNDYYSLRVSVQNQPNDNSVAKTWRGTVDFIRAGTETKLNEHNSVSLPLTVEANVDNFLDNSTMLNLSMYGNASLEKNRTLNYRYQTFFVNNFYSYTPYLGNSHYIGYFTPKASVQIGDVNGSSTLGFTPTGRGIKANYQIANSHTVGAFFLKGPGFFSRNFKTDYGFSYELRRGNRSFENYMQFNKDDLLNTTGIQYSNKLKFLLGKTQNFVISTAYSNETYQGEITPISKPGYAYAINYSGAFNKFGINLSNSYGSAYSTGYRGIMSIGADLLYRLSDSRSFSASAFVFNQNPQYFSSVGLLIDSRQTSVERYELKYNFNKPEYNIAVKYQHVYNDVFNLRSESNGLAADFRPKASTNLRFFLSVAGAYNKLLDYDMSPYFTSQIRTNIRYKGFTNNLRYYYGPYQTYEQLLFANSKVNSQSFFTNTSLRMWLLKNTLTFEPSVIYSYETLFQRHRLSARPEFYYLPKRSALELRFYGQYVNSDQKNNPFINLDAFQNNNNPLSVSNVFFGLGLKKRLGVPVSAKKYYKLGVSVFKDLNGNGKQDKNEPGLKNVLVNIKPLAKDSTRFSGSGMKESGEHFITDAQGKIAYNNLPKGSYNIKIVPLTDNEGYFAGSEQIVNIEKDKNLLMPLNQGVQLTGIIMPERDPTAVNYDKEVDLSKIRIIALDSLGKNYSTLTDKNGRFSMRMPAGIYQISINENALPDNFELDQRLATIDMITVSDIYNITFVIHEKKRKINTKKFDSKGNVIE
ncbi:MAG: hypothetical protein H7Y07_01700 [Pyrinomonadaceae bacterium]|nr:hypothetical protein [Sphingobacteriaceae bacterium]